MGICARTGFNGTDTHGLIQEDRMIGQYFAAPYLHYAQGVGFVVVSQDQPLGYILGVADTEAFNRWMNSEWLPQVRMEYPLTLRAKGDFDQFLLDLIHADTSLPEWASSYPGHLHIDLLDEVQGHGWGTRLMKTFLGKLADMGCPGIHLAVGSENTKAIRFYHSLGFSNLEEVPGALFMGLKIAPKVLQP